MFMILHGKLGSLEMIILPVLIPVLSGLIGLITLPYVQTITKGFGHMVNSFTDLNPLIMSILISVTSLIVNGYTYFISCHSNSYKFNWFEVVLLTWALSQLV